MDKYICECCGGKINRATMACEYCGTQYKEEAERMIRFETYRNPYRKLIVKSSYPEEAFTHNARDMAEYAIRNMAGKLAEGIIPYMVVESQYNPEYRTREMTAQIRVVEPKEGAERWAEREG